MKRPLFEFSKFVLKMSHTKVTRKKGKQTASVTEFLSIQVKLYFIMNHNTNELS